MAEIEELRAKAVASMNARGSSKSDQQGNSNELGRKGKPDEGASCCSSEPSSINKLAKATDPNLKYRQRKRLRSGNVPHWSSSPSSLADTSQRSALKNHSKNILLPNKSPSANLHGHSGSNDDLIINFSGGDDSDSESENSSSRRKVTVKGNQDEADRSRKPIQMSKLQRQILHHGVNYRQKIVPRKTPVSGSSGSLSTRAHGPSNSIAVENQIPSRPENSSNMIVPYKEIRLAPDVNVAEDKVRSLREQIAARENVLRLQKMSFPVNNDGLAMSHGFCSGTDMQLEAKASIQSSLGVSTTSNEGRCSKPERQSLEPCCHSEIVNMVGQGRQYCGPTLKENNAVDMQHGRMYENSCVSSDVHQLQAKEDKPLTSLQVTNFNNPNELEPLEQTTLDREGILHLEELHDKELEGAQEYRRKCELEEMQALKAYRKAREALIASNDRCSLLLRKRELLSLLASKWSNSGENFPKNSCDPLAEIDRLMVSEREDYDQVNYKESDMPGAGVETASDVGSRRTSVQHDHDLELEVSLREKLVANLGRRSSLKSNTKSFNTDGIMEKALQIGGGDENDGASVWAIPSVPNQLFQEPQNIIEGSKIPERNDDGQISERVMQSGANDLCFDSTINLDDCKSYSEVDQGFISAPSCAWIVCHHFKLFPSKLSRTKHNILTFRLPAVDTHDSDFSRDPFWPVCMFELRGKCNDDECPWQHLKGHNQQKLKPIALAANQVEPSRKVNGVHGFSNRLRHYTVSIPLYHIGPFLIEADTLLNESVLACCTQQYWDIAFCASPSLPLSIQRVLPLCAEDGHRARIDDRTKKLDQGLNDPEQILEIALELINGKMSNMAVKKEVLSLLSRALEADPNSSIFWIVYLHIYYRKEKSIGKDDMFSYAVKFNQDSYELWHLYIGSRLHFKDRMVAFDKALSALCQQARALSVEESNRISSCILDLTMQLINSLLMYGDVNEAVSRVLELTHPDSDILSCLLTSDRCILLICCLYLVIYERLPEAIVHQFELEKDLSFLIEWPAATHLSTEQKSRALELLEKAVGTGKALEVPEEGLERSTHFVAVNHIKCLVAISGGLDRASSDLLTEYMRMHPTCIDLHLIALHLHKPATAVEERVKEALENWPKESPGSQRLWNLCAAYCLSHGKFEAAEKLMENWFHCFCKTETEPVLTLTSLFSCKQDVVFGLLNLGLSKLMQRNIEEARRAVDQAMDLSTDEEYNICVREHAVLSACSLSSSAATLNLLTGYLCDSRSRSSAEPLTRRALTSLKKPKLRQLVVNFLGPVSTDFSLLNSILEALYGPSLLPETFDRAKDLVDFVESLMELTPSNHQLARSTCYSLSTGGCHMGFGSRSMMFWAGTLLVNAVFQCAPVAPESVWLKAVNALSQLQSQTLLESFHKRAVSVHPFSLKLWQSYFKLSEANGSGASVAESARKRGFELL